MTWTERHSPPTADADLKPVQIVEIIDHGTVVTLVGHHAVTGRLVYIHFDHRCFAPFWADWLAAGLAQAISWDAGQGVVSFDDGGNDG